MTIRQIARILCLKEGLKKSISIAQVCEVLKLLNDMTSGELYKLLRRI